MAFTRNAPPHSHTHTHTHTDRLLGCQAAAVAVSGILSFCIGFVNRPSLSAVVVSPFFSIWSSLAFASAVERAFGARRVNGN